MDSRHLSGQFTLLVYPFRHSLDGRDRADRLSALPGFWRPWWDRFREPSMLAAALDATSFFLPYVRGLLFPDAGLRFADSGLRPVDRGPGSDRPASRTAPGAAGRGTAAELGAAIRADGALRLTADLAAAGVPDTLEFVRPREEGCIRVGLGYADAVMFPQGVGFLVLEVRLEEAALSVGRLREFLGAARLVAPPRAGWELGQWVASDGLAFSSEALLDFLLQGLAVGAAPVAGRLPEYLGWRARTPDAGGYAASAFGQVYGPTFRLYTYACLDAGDGPTTLPPGEVGIPVAGATPFRLRREWLRLPVPPEGAGPFRSIVQGALYELATCTDPSHPDFEPHEAALAQRLDTGQIALWANWEGLALHDAVVFLGVRPSRFTNEVLPLNVAGAYFHLYLLTLYQKLRLNVLAGELERQDARLDRNLREARTLFGDFLRFRNHYWFSEVTLRPQGTELYRRFLAGLEVSPLFECVKEEVRDLHEYYEGRAQRRIGDLLNALAFLGLPASLLVSLFANALVKSATWTQFLAAGGAVYAVVGLLWLWWKAKAQE
jgi:hypothetical protein